MRIFFNTAFVNNTAVIGHINIFYRKAEFYNQIQAGKSCRARARNHQFALFNILADHFQAIQNGRADYYCGAVLIVMEHRYVHAFA